MRPCHHPPHASAGTGPCLANHPVDQGPRVPGPVKLLATGWVLWICIYGISGLTYRVPFPFEAFLVLAIGSMALATGSLLSVRSRPHLPRGSRGESAVGHLLVSTSSLALLSVTIRAVVGEPVIPVGAAAQLATARIETNLLDAGMGLREIGTPMSTFGVAAGIILAYKGRSQFAPTAVILGLAATGQYLMFGLAQGSRAPLGYALLCWLLAYMARPQRRRIGARGILGGVALFALVFSLSSWILSGRLYAQGFSLTAAVTYLETAHYVNLPDTLTGLSWQGGAVGIIAYTVISLLHYPVHGVFEFAHLYWWRDLVDAPQANGSATFGPVANPVLDFLGASPPPVTELTPRVGVYQGLAGSLLIDFGPFGAIGAMLVLGTLAGYLYRKFMTTGRTDSLLLYVPVAVVVLLLPYFNAIAGAYGLYTFFACAISGLMLRHLREAQ